MSLLLYRIGRGCARHRVLVLLVWAVAVIGIVAASRAVGEQTSDDLTLPGTGSTDATDLLDDNLPGQANGSVPIVLQSTDGRLDSGANKRAVNATVTSLRQSSEVRAAVSPLSAEGANALSKDGKIAYISVRLTDGPGDLDNDAADEVLDATSPGSDAGLEVSAGGYLGQQLSKPSTHNSEVIGIGAAIAILLLSLGTVVAMALPIAVAIIAVVTGVSAIGLLGHVVEVPTVASTLGTMIGLGVGIDYSLFIVTRYRRRLADGLEPTEAIGRAAATSGSAVAFAGGTVVIALLSLVFAKIPLVSALGYSAAIVVAVAVCAATTLLPALLAVIGPRIESARVPHVTPTHHDDHPHGWARWARGVATHPWPAMLAAIAVLVVLALPLLDMRLGQEDVGVLPTDTTARQAYDGIKEGFGPGENGPLLIAVRFAKPAHNDQGSLNQLKQKEQRQEQQQQQAVAQQTEQLELEGVPPDEAQAQATQQAQAAGPSKSQQKKTKQQKQFLRSTASDPDLVKLENKISKDPGVKSVSQAKVDPKGRAAVFTAVPTTAPSSYATQDTVNRLRDDVIPKAVAGTSLTAYVGGTTAAYIDLADRITDKLPMVIAIVVGLSFVLLLIAFRSLLVPITAALMNLLSVAAAYGVLTAVFEKGWGQELIGLPHPIPIESFVPLLMFAILFGLSMDYQVFLVSRISELWHGGSSNREAVIGGLATSARVITSAALIMVSVFASFILNGDPTVKQFGVGLAVAIAVDATIVRCLLVPAAMVLLGEANWWLPRALGRIIPRVGLESEEKLPPLPAKGEGAPAEPEAGAQPKPAPAPVD
jgi:RND superfamily putative drug exporter